MPRPDFLSPLHLFAALDSFPAAGSEQSPKSEHLLNPNKTAMLVDQFRFAGASPNVGTPLVSTLADWDFAYLGVELRLGSIPLTNGVVPIPSLCPRYFGFPDQLGTLGLHDTVLTWHLPRPLYVPPNVQLYARFVRQDIFPANNRATSIDNIGFSAVGRSMPADYPVPKKIWVPWATATQCKTAVQRFISKNQDLANPNTELLHVTSFVGFNTVGPNIAHDPTFPQIAPLTAQMTLSSNKMLMRDPTDFFGLFPADRGVLDVDAVLQSKEFVQAELELTPLTTGGHAVEYDAIAYTTIGMIGYREVQTPQGAVQP